MQTTEIALPTQVLVCPTKPEESQLDPVQNDHFWKPRFGGLWTSTLNDEGGEWLRWLTGEGYELGDEKWGGRLWQLTPREANVYTVWTPDELRELVDRYPHPELDSFNSLIGESLGGYLWVDWVEMAKEYDAVHVPNPWPWRFYGDPAASMFFYSMDAECTCWFRWCFEGEPVELDPEPFLVKLREKA